MATRFVLLIFFHEKFVGGAVCMNLNRLLLFMGGQCSLFDSQITKIFTNREFFLSPLYIVKGTVAPNETDQNVLWLGRP